MKIRQFILLSLFFIPGFFCAGDVGVDFKSRSCSIQGDSLVVSMECVVNTSELDARGAVMMVPVLKGGTKEKELLPVLLNGKKKQRTYERIQALNKRKGEKNEVFSQVIDVEDRPLVEFHYRTSVALENWMRTAGLFMKKTIKDDKDKIIQEDIVFVGNRKDDNQAEPVVRQPEVFMAESSPRTLKLKGAFVTPESDATDERNQKELNFSLDEARVMAEMNPQMLSLRELYMVALSYKNIPVQFYKIIDTSVRIYPANPIANLNAAAAAIERGDKQLAEKYLQMAPHETLAYKNCRGAYELLCGNLYEGIRLLKQAKSEGSEEAAHNLSVFFEMNKQP